MSLPSFQHDGADAKWNEGAHRRGVLLINLGTPDGPDVASVRRYLAEFLGDPDVIQLPRALRWMNGPLGWMIARFRGPQSAEMYRQIWTEAGSPLMTITQEQARLLSEVLPAEWRVYYAMRYGRPSTAEVLAQIAADGVDELVVIPMYPQFSATTTGTALRQFYRELERGKYHINVATRSLWYDDGGYVHAQAKLIEEYARSHGLGCEDTILVFSAHGLPKSYVERGDPYPAHIARTVQLVAERLGWPEERVRLGYQSRLGPVEWLKPDTDSVLGGLLEEGHRRILVCPVSFTTDCLETLEEIDVRYREQVEAGGGDLYLCPALNTFKPFIEALRNLVIRGPRPVAQWGERMQPLLGRRRTDESQATESWLDSLVMVGVSLDNHVGDGNGPSLDHAVANDLQCVKKTQAEMPGLLRAICAGGVVREGFVWNTCHRFEFYGWPDPTRETKEGDCLVARVQRALFNRPGAELLPANVLIGAEAWHHLVRTAAGLNSGLPGDADLLEQLETARRLAERSGTGGPMLDRLIREAMRMERLLRHETTWGRFDPGYCYAAMSTLVEETGLDLSNCRTVVIGGSSTSRSLLQTLINRFDVPSRQLTLCYRGHSGGQIKALRRAIQNGKRIRVQSYEERVVAEAIRGADLLVFGIDRGEPVMYERDLRELRDFSQRPLTIIDFNTFGSTDGVENLPGVRLVNASELERLVSTYAEQMCQSPPFREAAAEAEAWISRRIPAVSSPAVRPHECYSTTVENDSGNEGHGSGGQRWRRCMRCSRVRQESGRAVAGSRG